jgi:HSP20 family protein
MAMTIEIDDAIGRVEHLYRSVTGRKAPDLAEPLAPIPAERDPAHYVQEQMDRLLGLLGQTAYPAASPKAFAPPIAILEYGEEIQITVDVPGISRQSLEVSVHGAGVLVTGQRIVPGTAQPRLLEHPTGVIRRVIPLPAGARADQLTASLKDGVLTLRIPREAMNTHRTLQVSS